MSNDIKRYSLAAYVSGTEGGLIATPVGSLCYYDDHIADKQSALTKRDCQWREKVERLAKEWLDQAKDDADMFELHALERATCANELRKLLEDSE